MKRIQKGFIKMFDEIRTLFSINENDGFSQEIVDAACRKHGSLPEILTQYYIQLGKITALNQQHNSLLEPDKLIEAGEYLIFYAESKLS